MLFSAMNEVDMKFPRKMQISFINDGVSNVYYSNGKYVRRNHQVYELPEGQEYIFFQTIISKRVGGK
jgi:hypothetical protein